ncbi:hypothetical protein [Leuconostoc citreum]|uniref:hypothetical protein n=1 Tax=Leuconostoc citreum TaxID=33964 RepID=UPI0022E40635|nr:hypothetical protein [Leuconostoc citreum]
MANVVYAKQSLPDNTPIVVYNLSVTENINELSTSSFSFDDSTQNKIAALMMSPQTTIYVPEISCS